MSVVVDQTVSPLLDARQILADALTDSTTYEAHAGYTESFATPCFVLTGNGWTITTSGMVIYKITVTALLANQSGEVPGGVEELARLGVVACADAGFGVFEVPAAGTVNIGSREYAGVAFEAQIPVSLRSI